MQHDLIPLTWNKQPYPPRPFCGPILQPPGAFKNRPGTCTTKPSLVEKIRYDRFLKSVGMAMAADSQAAMAELLGRGPRKPRVASVRPRRTSREKLCLRLLARLPKRCRAASAAVLPPFDTIFLISAC